ncbi:MAG: exosortase A [Pseudomonadota bacterium]
MARARRSMPPETAHASGTTSPTAILSALPEVWRKPLACLGVAVLGLMLVSAREWGEMLHQWWNIDTYNHILLVPLIVIWLVWLKSGELERVAPRSLGWGMAIVAAGLALWLAGRVTDINLIAQAGAVGAVQGAIVAMLGARVAVLLALPLTYLAFLVPFGDEIIPQLQAITAQITIALTRWSGIPAVVDGIYIDTPVGLFIVAEACSGVKFLVAMVTLAVLVCFTRFRSWSRRAAFMAASIIIPVLANGVRAWGTVYIAQFAGVEFAAGFDHIFYGWIFFALVVGMVLAGAWRFFESEPEDYGFTARDLKGAGALAAIEGKGESPLVILAGIAALGMAAAIGAGLLAPAGLG